MFTYGGPGSYEADGAIVEGAGMHKPTLDSVVHELRDDGYEVVGYERVDNPYRPDNE
jgi:hypothetical protein